VKQKLINGAEYDVIMARRYYCYLQRAGVTSGIKRQIRRRARHESKQETWKEEAWRSTWWS
jgi:hypothetical protein